MSPQDASLTKLKNLSIIQINMLPQHLPCIKLLVNPSFFEMRFKTTPFLRTKTPYSLVPNSIIPEDSSTISVILEDKYWSLEKGLRIFLSEKSLSPSFVPIHIFFDVLKPLYTRFFLAPRERTCRLFLHFQ